MNEKGDEGEDLSFVFRLEVRQANPIRSMFFTFISDFLEIGSAKRG